MVSQSSLREYAEHFWRRQRGKHDPNDRETLQAIGAGGDPVALLRGPRYDFKLPKPHNDSVSIVLVTEKEDVENLLVRDYVPKDAWMEDRGLVPQPFTRKLGDLASLCLERGYFSAARNDRQIQYFKAWHASASLANVLSVDERPLIEVTKSGAYEIVDGWGRLLPFSALLVRGLAFAPFEVFLAWSTASCLNLSIEPDGAANGNQPIRSE